MLGASNSLDLATNLKLGASPSLEPRRTFQTWCSLVPVTASNPVIVLKLGASIFLSCWHQGIQIMKLGANNIFSLRGTKGRQRVNIRKKREFIFQTLVPISS